MSTAPAVTAPAPRKKSRREMRFFFSFMLFLLFRWMTFLRAHHSTPAGFGQ